MMMSLCKRDVKQMEAFAKVLHIVSTYILSILTLVLPAFTSEANRKWGGGG